MYLLFGVEGLRHTLQYSGVCTWLFLAQGSLLVVLSTMCDTEIKARLTSGKVSFLPAVLCISPHLNFIHSLFMIHVLLDNESSFFTTSLPALVVSCLYAICYSHCYEMISHCFDLLFSDNWGLTTYEDAKTFIQ